MLDGRSTREIADFAEVNVQTIHQRISEIRQHMGMKDLGAIARLAAPRIEAMRPLLPLTGRQKGAWRRPSEQLSEKCLPVLELWCRGATTQRMAQSLGLSQSTVWGRLNMIRTYFGVSDRYSVHKRAQAAGLLNGAGQLSAGVQ